MVLSHWSASVYKKAHKDYLKRYYGKNISYPQTLLSAERPYRRSDFKI